MCVPNSESKGYKADEERIETELSQHLEVERCHPFLSAPKIPAALYCLHGAQNKQCIQMDGNKSNRMHFEAHKILYKHTLVRKLLLEGKSVKSKVSNLYNCSDLSHRLLMLNNNFIICVWRPNVAEFLTCIYFLAEN